MLEHFAIKAGRSSLNDLRDWCTDRMAAVGLRGETEDVILAIGLLRDLIGTGCRSLERVSCSSSFPSRASGALGGRRPSGIQAIDRSPNAEGATEILDWVDLFDGLRRSL